MSDFRKDDEVLSPTLGEHASMKRHIIATILITVLGITRAQARRGNQTMRRVVTGLDDQNHAVVLFDSMMPLKAVAPGIMATNFWITDSYPPSLVKDDPSGRPIGTAPPDNGTKFQRGRVRAARCGGRGPAATGDDREGHHKRAGARHSGQTSPDASHA